MKKRVVNGQVDIFGEVSVTVTSHKKEKLSDSTSLYELRRTGYKAKPVREKGKKPKSNPVAEERNKVTFELIDGILNCFKYTEVNTLVAKGYDNPELAPIYTTRDTKKMNMYHLLGLPPKDRVEFLTSLPITSQIELKQLMLSLFR
jgi:hypothetical protein